VPVGDTLGGMNRTAVVAAAVIGGLVLAGCGGASNSGADTTCKDFLAMSDNDKDATAARMLKERNGRNGSTQDVEVKRITLVGLCQPADKQAATIGQLA
jgi:acid stress chaperone HdeA